MKIKERIELFSRGGFSSSDEWRVSQDQVDEAIRQVDWPWHSGKFTILAEKHGNGVKDIKVPCIKKLVSFGWHEEGFPRTPESVLIPGDLDAFYNSDLGCIGFEWETGNISSSHRAVNKLLWALKEKILVGAFLVVPSDDFYRYLTDRVGNIKELRPYIPLWKSYPIENAAFNILVIEYDSISSSVLRIPKGTDGRALV
jgi:hypothetical protein